MHSRDIERVLLTIDHNVSLARAFVKDMTFEAFAADDRTIYATTRCLEIISEASRRLPDDLKARHPSVPWERIAGAGNVYRHDYEDVLPSLLWTTVHEHLDSIGTAIREELK
jgi:uncharacterized protein with HEPN domain